MRAEVCRLHCRKSIVSVTDGILASHNSDIIIDMGFFAAKLTAGAGTGEEARQTSVLLPRAAPRVRALDSVDPHRGTRRAGKRQRSEGVVRRISIVPNAS